MNQTGKNILQLEAKTLRDILHPHARRQLQLYVSEIVSSTRIDNGTPDIPLDPIIKIKKMGGIVDLDSLDVVGFYALSFRKMDKYLNELQIDEHSNGCLKDLAQPEKLKEITDRFFEAVLDLPRDYEVRIPLPALTFTSKAPLVLNDCIKMIAKAKKDPGAAGLGVVQLYNALSDESRLEPSTTYLCVRVRGIACGLTSCRLFQSALSIARQFVAAALILDTLAEAIGRSLALKTAFFPHNGESKCFIYDESDKDENPLVVEMPATERLFLLKMEFGKRFMKDTEDLQKQQRLLKEAQAFSFLFCSRPANEEIDKEISRVRTALEWFFNALASDNETFAHVQLSIAMEALLGESHERDNIMDRLSNRCAFLVGRDPLERHKVKKRVEEAYDMRSRIIHRGEIKLSEKDFFISDSFKSLLKIAIRKELAGILRAIEKQTQSI